MSEQAEISMDQSDSDIAQRNGNLISSEPPKQAFPPAPQEQEEQAPAQEEPEEQAAEEQEAAPAQGEPDEFEWEWEGEKYVLPKALKPLTEAQMRQRRTAVTKDRSLAAHFEHTVAITGAGPVILTTPGEQVRAASPGGRGQSLGG